MIFASGAAGAQSLKMTAADGSGALVTIVGGSYTIADIAVENDPTGSDPTKVCSLISKSEII